MLPATCPEHIDIARKNTPLQKMVRLSEQFGVEIYFKRDDLTGSELSGNKIRKLEYLFADAKSNNADTVITCGGAQSNHCRATALAAVRCGMNSTLLLRTDDPQNPPETSGNILLDKLAGAEVVWVTPEEYRNIDQIFHREAERLKRAGKVPYIIPEGGSNHIGSWVYVTAMEEIKNDLRELGVTDLKGTTVLSATGSGGTTAGLLLGKKLLGLELDVVGVNVCDDEEYFKNRVGTICHDFCRNYNLDLPIAKDEIHITDGYVGRGYALSRREELEAIYNLSSLEGVILDPVYTGKAYFGMVSELERNRNVFGERIVFIHTGGIFGVFPAAELFEEFL